MGVHINDVTDPTELAAAIEAGHVSARPSEGLTLYTYTDRCTWEHGWNRTTMACRGLIADDNGRVVARPFGKFFNHGEPDAPPAPDGPFEVTEKLDGSLGIIFTHDGVTRVATRGSLTSPQAEWATAWWAQHFGNFGPPEGVTWLGEIIYPENRVVLDYGGREDVVGLAAIDNATGADVPLDGWPGRTARRYACADVERVRSLVADDGASEGFVVTWRHELEPSTRLKLKMPEYVRLHRFYTGLSERAIWEAVARGDTAEDIAAGAPDELHVWIAEVVARLQAGYDAVLTTARAPLALCGRESRRDDSAVIVPTPYAGVTWKLYDGKDAAPMIWRLLKPAGVRTFRVDADAMAA